MSREQHALERVAVLYYQEHLTQEQIAARLSLSRSKVVRLLQQARRCGIVRIHIIPSGATHVELERKLEARFGLRHARIAASGTSPSETLALVGAEAATWVADVLRPGDTLVLSSGRSIAALVDAMQPMHAPRAKLVEMQGVVGFPAALPEFGTDHLAARLASKMNAQYRMLPVPRYVSSPEVVSALLLEASIRSTLELARTADICVLGIGGMEPLSPTLPPLSPASIKALRARGAVGEISAQFFDADGRPCPSDIDQRLVGLKLSELLDIPVRMAIACGREKVPAIVAALTGRYANVLVTDVETAVALMEYVRPQPARGAGPQKIAQSLTKPRVARGRTANHSSQEVKPVELHEHIR